MAMSYEEFLDVAKDAAKTRHPEAQEAAVEQLRRTEQQNVALARELLEQS